MHHDALPHGVAASAFTCQANLRRMPLFKWATEEEKAAFNPAQAIDGTEQVIDWDYRSVLTNLVVGQTVTFAVELTDGYPGENGPHLARTAPDTFCPGGDVPFCILGGRIGGVSPFH